MSGPGPVPEPVHLNKIPDGRDLRPENRFSRHLPPEAATCHPRMEALGQHVVLSLPRRLRLLLRLIDQREDADRHHEETGVADPLGQAEEFREAEFAVSADGQDVRGDPIEGERVGDAADDHPGEAGQGVQTARSDGGEAGARAIAVKNHADPEDRGAEADGEEVGRLDVILREVLAMQDGDADAADEIGRASCRERVYSNV